MADLPTQCSDWWTLIQSAFDDVCAAHNGGRFAPLLEADLAGYVYHVILLRLGGDARCIHLDTRVLGVSGNEKYDLVVGTCVDTEERRQLALDKATADVPDQVRRFLKSKAALSVFRPAVRPDLVLEFKFFAAGFTPPQLREHQVQAVKDVAKTQALGGICDEGRGVVLFDDAGYVTPARESQLLEARGEDRNLRIYLFQRNSAQEMKWRTL